MRPNPVVVVLAHVGLLLVSLVTIYPVLWVVKMAFSPGQGFSVGLWPFPSAVTLEHFSAVIGTTASDGTWLLGSQLLNSLLVSGATSMLGSC